MAFAAGLHPKGDNQVEWGSGVFVSYADGDTEPPTEGSVTGVVTDANDHQPVAGATVTLTDDQGNTVDSAASGADGGYGVDVEPGTYTATATATRYSTTSRQVTVTDADQTQEVDFALATAVMEVTPGSLSFDSADGTSQSAQVTIANSGSAPLAWSAGADGWLSVSPTSGTVAAGESTTVTATVDSTDLSDGTHQLDLTVSGDAARTPSVSVPVTLVVGDGGPDGDSAARVNLGGDDYTAVDGDAWAAEQASVDGGQGYLGAHTRARDLRKPIAGTDDDLLFQQSRSGVTGYVFGDRPAGTYRFDLGYVAMDGGVHAPTAVHHVFTIEHDGGALTVHIPAPDGLGAQASDLPLTMSIASIEVTPGS